MLDLFLIVTGPLNLFFESSEKVACVIIVFGYEYILLCIFTFEKV